MKGSMLNSAIITLLFPIMIMEIAIAQGPPSPPGPFPPPNMPGKHEGPGAQAGRGPRGPFIPDWEDKDLKELIDTVRIYRLSKTLELSDEQTVLLMRRYDDFKKKVAELWEKRTKTMDLLREKVEGGAPESEIEEILNSLARLEEESSKARTDLIQKSGEGLTVMQRARMLLFLQDFERDMRRLIERAREFQGGDKDAAKEQLKKRIREWQEPHQRNESPAGEQDKPNPPPQKP